jgi:putative DNA primase/helicase
LFRVVEVFKPTLLIDEADTFIRTNDDGLRGILNSGHLRASAQIVRTVGEEHEPRLFSTWAPKAIACIRHLPDTLEDRSIVLRLRRRAPGDTIADFPSESIHHELEPVRRQIARWAADNKEALGHPDVPNGLNDRARDNWKPLLAIADAIGQVVGDMARKAAMTVSSSEVAEAPASEMLLADIRDLFDSRHTHRLKSEDIIEALVQMEERPWPEWYRGKPMSKTAMSRQLKRFDIRPKMIRIGGETVRGYDREWFEDAFGRYLPCSTATPATPPENTGVSPDAEPQHTEDDVAVQQTRNPSNSVDVAGVAVEQPLLGLAAGTACRRPVDR